MSSPFGGYTYVGCWFNHGQDVIRGLPDIFDELRPGDQYHPRLQSGDFEDSWSCLRMGTSSTLHDECVMIEGKIAYFLVALFDHAAAIKNLFESSKVRENWVREPDGWYGIELGTCVFVKDCDIEMGAMD